MKLLLQQYLEAINLSGKAKEKIKELVKNAK